METFRELFGSFTPNKHNRRPSQKESAMLFYGLQLSFCNSESQCHSHLHHLALQNKAEQFGFVIPKNTINASNLIDFSWDQIFHKVMIPCMIWRVELYLCLQIDLCQQSFYYTLFFSPQDVFG